MKKIHFISLALALILIVSGCSNSNTELSEADKGKLVIFRDAGCGCCSLYSNYAQSNGMDADLRTVSSMEAIKLQYKVPRNMQSCHTSIVEGYFVEGHVPLEAINKLLSEKPDIAGIALPGMPMGSPGMTGAKTGPFVVYSIGKDGKTAEFMRI